MGVAQALFYVIRCNQLTYRFKSLASREFVSDQKEGGRQREKYGHSCWKWIKNTSGRAYVTMEGYSGQSVSVSSLAKLCYCVSTSLHNMITESPQLFWVKGPSLTKLALLPPQMRLIDMNQTVCPPLLGAIISCSAQPHSAVMIIIIMSTNDESRGNSIQLRPKILNSTEK